MKNESSEEGRALLVVFVAYPFVACPFYKHDCHECYDKDNPKSEEKL